MDFVGKNRNCRFPHLLEICRCPSLGDQIRIAIESLKSLKSEKLASKFVRDVCRGACIIEAAMRKNSLSIDPQIDIDPKLLKTFANKNSRIDPETKNLLLTKLELFNVSAANRFASRFVERDDENVLPALYEENWFLNREYIDILTKAGVEHFSLNVRDETPISVWFPSNERDTIEKLYSGNRKRVDFLLRFCRMKFNVKLEPFRRD